MANTVLKYGIIDSGLDFVDPAYDKAYELIADKFKAIKLTAALDKHVGVALSFGLEYLNVSMDDENLNNQYYILGNGGGKIRGTSLINDVPYDSVSETYFPICDNSLITFAKIFNHGDKYDIDSDLSSTYGASFGRVYLDETNIDYGNIVHTLTTAVEYNRSDTLEEILQKMTTSTVSASNELINNLTWVFYNTITHSTNNYVEFISLDQLDWINANPDKFFGSLSRYLSHYKNSGGGDLSPNILSIKMIVFAVSEEGSSDPLPLSTIKSLVVYK